MDKVEARPPVRFKISILLFLLVSLSPSTAYSLTLDESPLGPGDWGFRPLEGEAAIQTPPGFVWRPVEGAVSYALQIASEQAFEDLVYHQAETPWSAHCPDRVLPEGTYYWRYSASSATGETTPWSRPRSFQVTAESVPFPQPSLSELLERMPKQHPRLFFREEDLPGLRGLSKGPLEGRWKDLLSEAEKLLKDPPDTSEPPAYPEGLERESAEWKKIWWGNRTRGIAGAEGAATLAFVFQLSGEERFGRAARELLLELCRWDPEGPTGFAYNDEAAMPLVYFPSRAFSWVYPLLSAGDRAAIGATMRIRGGQVFNHLSRNHHLWRPYDSHRNRAWHFLGELAIAFQGEIPEAEEWLDYAMTLFHTVYPAWGDEDGGWSEGIAYWISYLQRFLYWDQTIRSAFGIDVFEKPFFRKTGYFGMMTLPPGTQAGAFGDQAALVDSKQIGNFMASLATRAANPHWQWYAEQVGGTLPPGYLGFLMAAGAGSTGAAPPDDLPSSMCFRGTGVAVLNSNLADATANVQVHFKSSPRGRQSHGYNANNAFLLNLGGRRVFVQSGERDISGSSHHKEWMWESKSDNSILVNGAGQKRHSFTAVGRITDFLTSDRVDVVAGEAAGSYPDRLTRFDRRIVFLKPHAIVIHDILEATAPSTFQWTLHATGPFAIGENEMTWEGEPGKVRVQFLEPAGLQITQTDRFDPPPAAWSNLNLNQWHLTAEAISPVQRREFLSLILIGDSEVEVDSRSDAEGNTLLSLRTEEESADLIFGDHSFRVQTPGFDQEFSARSGSP